MKTNKKFYAFMLSLAMMLSAISPAFAAVVNYGDELTNMPNKNYTQKFSDVPSSFWAFSPEVASNISSSRKERVVFMVMAFYVQLFV